MDKKKTAWKIIAMGEMVLLSAVEDIGIDEAKFGDMLRVRPGETTPGAVKELHKMGLKLVMLTGDNEFTARAIAEKLGINEYYAGLHPDEKRDIVKGFTGGGKRVLMAGI